MRSKSHFPSSVLSRLTVAVALFIVSAVVAARPQNPVPPTAREAAGSPAFASKLHPSTRPPMTKRRASAPACASGAHRAKPQDSVIYENGPVNGTTDAWTINYGYIVSDSFYTSVGQVGGFDLYTWEIAGDSLTSIQWTITSGPNSGTVYGSGTVGGSNLTDTFISTNQYGYDIDKVSATGLNVSVTSGSTYWLNVFNAAVPSGDPVYWDENSGKGCTSPGCPSQAYESELGTIPSEAFDITSSSSFGCFQPQGNLKVIHDFTSSEVGQGGLSGVAIDQQGNLYGTLHLGGDNDLGSAFKLSQKAQGWIFTDLYGFTGGYQGQDPNAFVLGLEGRLYGSADGGLQNCSGFYCGLVYSLGPSPTACRTSLCSWTENVLYRSTGENDPIPYNNLVFDQAGNLYGTGGYYENGAVLEMTSSNGSWAVKVLYIFSGGTDGSGPTSLLVGNDGNLYGTTWAGGDLGYCYNGSGCGAVFQLVPSGNGWTENPIYTFQGQNDGYFPYALVQDSSGNLIGLAYYDQQHDEAQATIFMLSPSGGKWTFTTLVITSGHDFGYFNNLALSDAGDLYITGGGSDGNCAGLKDIFGSAFQGARGSDGWQWTSLVYLWDQHFDTAGALAVDAQGNLYGTTSDCGKYGYGTAWQISP
jgi:hypothetical protein